MNSIIDGAFKAKDYPDLFAQFAHRFAFYSVTSKDVDSILSTYPDLEDKLYYYPGITPLLLIDEETHIITEIHSLNPEFIKSDLSHFYMFKHRVENGDFDSRDVLQFTDTKYRESVMFSLFNSELDIDNIIKRDILEETYSSLEYINDYDSFRDLFIQLKRYSGDIDLEDEVVIYRGGTDRSTDIEEALSWTTSLDVAKFFSTRFDGEQFLFKAKVKKENILAYINSRKEYEVIVSFEDIYDVSQIN